MAQALGGRVEKFSGGWAVGPQEYQFDTGPLQLNAWHQDQVVTPPEDAQTIGRNAFCAHAALLYPGQGLSVQAHPEFEDTVVQGLIDHRGPGIVPEQLLQSAQAGLGRADSRPVANRIATFFKQHAGVRI
jgi:GMP synthase-like glutamine amidotransferase